jgi:hypothetical protein
MQRQTIVLVVGLIVALIAGMFVFAYLKQAEYDARLQDEAKAPAEEDSGFDIARIDAKHFYAMPQGVHTLAGEILMPTPCDLIDTNVALVDDRTRAIVSFGVINNSGGACAQVATPQRFSVSFEAPEGIAIEAYFMGKPVELNLIPPAPGETPTDFEIMNKG